MVKCLKLKKEKGESAKQFIEAQGWLDKGRALGRTQRYLLIPLAGKFNEKVLLKKFPDASIEARSFQLIPPRAGTLKDLLKGVIPEKYIEKVVRAFDIVGDIAVLDIPDPLKKFELSIAWALKRAHPYIKTVVRKAGKVKGKHRVRELKILTGEKRTETIYKEHNITLKLDLAKTYFSPRSARERLRIAEQVKQNEKVLVMFAGIGPYAILIAKHQPLCRVWAVELNPDAYNYMKENIRLNLISNATALKGDVKKVVPEIGEFFDRIIMPLPEKSWEFLDLALKSAAPEAIIHFYAFIHEDKFDDAIGRLNTVAKKNGKKIKILKWIRAGTYAPRVYRWCIDFQLKA